jgi:hypothetical protein
VDLPVIPIIPGKTGAGSGCASSGCGSAPDALAHLPDHIRRKVQDRVPVPFVLNLAVSPILRSTTQV